jgi:ceramide glucosyltransferase
MGDVVYDLSLWQIIAWIGMAVSSWFSLTCAYSSWDFFARRRREDAPSPDWMPAVTMLKPLKGLDPQLYENLSTFCRQDYPHFQIVFGVADLRDPAVAVVRRLQAEHPRLAIELIIDGRLYGTNDKVSNLINMYRSAEHDVLVLSDGDIRVPRDYLRRVVAPLRDERIGLVTCLYRAVAVRSNLPTLLWCSTINALLTPQILGARKVEKPTYAFGATLALRRSTLHAVHGFEEIANMLADDYQLGNRIASQGLRLWLSECVVDTVLALGSWRELFQHLVRRARTNRSHRPIGYFFTVLTQGLLWAIVNVVAGGAGVLALSVSWLVITIRLATVAFLDHRSLGIRLGISDMVLALFTDLLQIPVWVGGLLGSSVWWSGRRFRISKSGEMEALPMTAPP